MRQRIRQFIQAVFGRLDAEGHCFVRSYLSNEEQRLFYAMHEADQFHAFRVALTARELYTQYGQLAIDEYILLIRCALLHDVGRVKGDADIWGKVLAVLFYRFGSRSVPYFMRKKDTDGFFGKIGTALYVYVSHPYIGAEKLRAIGDFHEAEIIQHHQKKAAPEDSLVLSLLKTADSRN